MRRTHTLACLLAGAALVACSGESPSSTAPASPADSSNAPAASAAPATRLETRFVNIATGGASGPYNILGTALAEIYAKKYGANSKTQTTGASVENINLINQGKVEMAFVMSDALSDAVHGENSFPQKITTVAQIAALYPNYVQIVTSADSGIRTITDLKSKRIAVGAQNSGVEVNARTLLNGVGITYNDIKVDYLGYAEAADALKAGKLDAAFLTSGLPNSSLMELQQGFKLQLVSITPEQVARIGKDKSYFIALDIPQGTYGNAENVPTAAIRNALVVRANLSDSDVYELTKTFFTSLDTLKTAHQAAGSIDLTAQHNFVAPMHPGAKRYFDELAAGNTAGAPAQ